MVGRHDRLPVAGRARRAGERVEELGHVGGERRVAREQAEVLVEARRLAVVVARPDMHVVAQAAALAAHHEQRLGVGLQAGQPVHHVSARLFQRARPADVAALVEARLELHQAHRLLAALGRLDQGRHQAESSEVRYTVIFSASTSGSATACCTKRSTLPANEW